MLFTTDFQQSTQGSSFEIPCWKLEVKPSSSELDFDYLF